jgi:membrane-associated phospholipid phosphatase
VDIIWNFGIQVVLWFQALGSGLTAPMRAISFMGQQEFFLVVMPAIFWCLDAGVGFRVGAMLLLGNSLNTYLKILFHGPRPFWYSLQVKALSSETSFGLPSGHAQNAAAIWGLLAALLRKGWAWAAALAIIFTIGISRLYLGMHFPSDVFAGWLIVFGLVGLFVWLDAPVTRWIRGQSFSTHVLLGFAGSLVIIGLYYLSAWAVSSVPFPYVWIQNANLADPAHPMDPLSAKDTFTCAGVWFGLAAGAAWLWRRGWFDARGTLEQRFFRYLIGVAGVLILYAGLGALFPHTEDLTGHFFRYIRYGFIGAWVAGGAPQIFIRLRLAAVPGQENQPAVVEPAPQ